MEKQATPDFLVIDDDPINNIIFQKITQRTFPGADIHTFTDAEDVLTHVDSTYGTSNANNAVLFVDINMPLLNGWELLEKFSGFSNSVKAHFKIFILSSSVDEKDMQKAGNNPLVSGYLVKPLSMLQFQNLFTGERN